MSDELDLKNQHTPQGIESEPSLASDFFPFPLIYEDEYFFAIDKPSGFFVHPPEMTRHKVPEDKICLYALKRHLGYKPIPVHRLDAPTSGLVLFAKNTRYAAELNFLFSEREIKKTYHAVVRGFTPTEGCINSPLEIMEGKYIVECETNYKTLSNLELNVQVTNKYPTSRYSLVEIYPRTGRWHQIRRHFDRMSHPLIGDTEHGDSYHNRYFRDSLDIKGLCLRATELEFIHPWTETKLLLKVADCPKWKKIRTLFSTPSV